MFIEDVLCAGCCVVHQRHNGEQNSGSCLFHSVAPQKYRGARKEVNTLRALGQDQDLGGPAGFSKQGTVDRLSKGVS